MSVWVFLALVALLVACWLRWLRRRWARVSEQVTRAIQSATVDACSHPRAPAPVQVQWEAHSAPETVRWLCPDCLDEVPPPLRLPVPPPGRGGSSRGSVVLPEGMTRVPLPRGAVIGCAGCTTIHALDRAAPVRTVCSGDCEPPHVLGALRPPTTPAVSTRR